MTLEVTLKLVLALFLVYVQGVHIPAGWKNHGPSSLGTRITLHLGLALENPHRLESVFWAVSDPRNKQYGQYISMDEANALAAPHPSARAVVTAWLSQHGVEETDIAATSSSDWLIVRWKCSPVHHL